MIKISINGLGRIGRAIIRLACFEYRDCFDLVSINSPGDNETLVHLLKYDSIHGIDLKNKYECDKDNLYINGKKIRTFHTKNVEELDWSGVDVVMECTGKLTSSSDLRKHISKGAKKVILSSPAKDKDTPTIVYKVNCDKVDLSSEIFSIGSCTTNCIAPVLKVLDENFGIESGFMTTVHAYTNDQNIIDNSHKDLRRARAATMSIIPTSTGAANAIGLVLPNLAGKIQGNALRVPVPNVSISDLSCNLNKKSSIEELKKIFVEYSENQMSGVLSHHSEPLVSIDFVGNPHSSIVDLSSMNLIGDKFIKISSWYDNEWGFSNRMLDVANKIINKL
jgi:glyceraldehyde 3-phosphate dehydrogenase